MQVTETLSEDLRREFKIVVSAKDIAEKLDHRLAELGRTMRLPGFRPGKVPTKILKQRFAKGVMGEILEQTVSDSATQAMAEQGVQPAMQPKIEVTSFEDGKDLEYTMAVELVPDIQPMEFSTLELERLTTEVQDSKVDEMVKDMAAQSKRSEPIGDPRESKAGDVLVLDYTGTVDGQPFEGGTASGHFLELGSGTFIPGFEDQLIGLAVGDAREVKITFPNDYANDALAGKPAAFDVKVTEIRERRPVEADDAFAKSMGLENLAALRDAMRERMSQEYAGLARARLKRQLLDKLAAAHDFMVPPGMLEQEFDAIWQQRENQQSEGASDPDEAGKEEQEIKDDYRGIAERRVRLGLLLNEVGRANSIQVTQEELNRAIAAEAQGHPGHERKIFEYYRDNPEAAAALRAPIFEEKVVDFIIEMAKLTDRTVSLEELMRDPDAAPPVDAKATRTKKKSPATKKRKPRKKG